MGGRTIVNLVGPPRLPDVVLQFADYDCYDDDADANGDEVGGNVFGSLALALVAYLHAVRHSPGANRIRYAARIKNTASVPPQSATAVTVTLPTTTRVLERGVV